jgi:hypothetical protein
MITVLSPEGDVAKATLHAMSAQPTKTAAASFNFVLLIVISQSGVCAAIHLATVDSGGVGQARCRLWPSERRAEHCAKGAKAYL